MIPKECTIIQINEDLFVVQSDEYHNLAVKEFLVWEDTPGGRIGKIDWVRVTEWVERNGTYMGKAKFNG